MNSAQYSWIFIIGGAILMVLEIVLPGLIAVFLGAAAVIVGFLALAGMITGIGNMLLAWVILSFALVLIFRRLALKLFPSDRRYQFVEDDVSAIGQTVEVIKTVDDRSTDGRISYNGTSWPAMSSRGTIEAGDRARIVYRDNISWVVEPVDDDSTVHTA